MELTATDYAELIALSKRYLEEECLSKKWVFAPAESVLFYRQAAREHKQAQPALHTPAIETKAPPVEVQRSAPFQPAAEMKPPAPQTAIPIVADENHPPQAAHAPPPAEAAVKVGKQPFRLDLPSTPATADFTDLRTIIEEKASYVQILETPAAAHKRAPAASFIIIAFSEEEMPFLKTLGEAITTHLTPARVVSAAAIEKQQAWKQLLESSHVRAILASAEQAACIPALENQRRSSSGHEYIGDKIFIPLKSSSHYQVHLSEKQTLWKSIKSYV